MKNLNIISILILVIGLNACTDLDENPVGVLAPEGFFKTENDVEAMIYGAYGRMASENYWGRKLSFCVMYRSDMVAAGYPGIPARRIQIDNFTNDAYNGMVTSFWPRSYDIISAANTAIYGAESLGNIADDKRDRLIAESRFIRASVYFNLVRLFGAIPYIDEMVTDPESLIDIPKTSEKDVYQAIIDDLLFGVEHLPDFVDARSRPSIGAAATMLADVYLTLENWQEAYNYAKWVIDKREQFEYSLEPDYQDLFDATKQDGMNEHIFVLDFLGLNNGSATEGDDILGPMTGIRGTDMMGWGAAIPLIEVYHSFDNRDYRKAVAWDTVATIEGEIVHYTEFPNEKRPHIAKYTRYMGNATTERRYTDFNYALYRYAEVLLIAAEAGNEVNQGPNAELEGYVNQVRARARYAAGEMNDFPYDVETGLSREQFLDVILEERRIELCFEVKRWWDIKRRKLGEEVFKGPNSIEPQPNFQNYHYYLPLPQDELDRNPNLLPQNEGYN